MSDSTNTPEAPVEITATTTELAAAFDEWLRQYNENPEAFFEFDSPEFESSTYGEICTAKLLKLLGVEE